MPPDTRGRTTQKRVSSTRKCFASLTSSAVTTHVRAVRRERHVRDQPDLDVLVLDLGLARLQPFGGLKVMVIVGPLSRIALTASQPPTSAATIGMSQTSCSERRRFRARRRPRGCSGSRIGVRSVRQPWGFSGGSQIRRGSKGMRREHGQHHDGAEGDRAGARLDRRQRLQLHQRDDQRHHVDVEHRPAARRAPPAGTGACAAWGASASGAAPKRAAGSARSASAAGTVMLARRRSRRSYQEPLCPEVDHAAHDGVRLRSRRANWSSSSAAGSRGCSRISAAISSAQQRDTLSGLRKCRAAPQRGQAAWFASATGAANWPQVWQLSSPARRATVGCGGRCSSSTLPCVPRSARGSKALADAGHHQHQRGEPP